MTYDASEWKPGDVAMVTGRWAWNMPHSVERAFRDGECWTIGTRDVMDHEVSGARPLVVIDPEDHAATQRLGEAYCAVNNVAIGPNLAAERVAAALREFARPTPRIEEPMGLGAVVADARGAKFVRRCDCGSEHDWWAVGAITAAVGEDWSDLNAVRILSPGVTS